ncbi:nitrogen regulation protein NR(II) [Castellaniella sp.]|uniref:nitrogen regulation protein NR(II) n=1 Tax=Castellaniella sp. TaxID=1955812 RepID=UPI00355E33B6
MGKPVLHRLLLDSQRTALVLLDHTLTIHYLNAAAEALLSASRRHLRARALESCWQDDGGMADTLRECLKIGQSITCREVPVRTLTGMMQTIDYSVARLEKDGQVDAHAGSRTPFLLLEMQPVERQLRLSREEGRAQAQQAINQLVRGMAHEIRNPLGGIRGAAQLMATALPDPEWQEYLNVIIAESDRLQALAGRMLGIGPAAARSEVNIHECLERARTLVQVEQPGLPIMRDYDPSLPTILADHDQLVQVLLNLVRNAMQVLVEHAVPDARILLRTRADRQLTLHGRCHRLVLRIDVIDNGPGVPESLQDALFFPMVTGRANGIGLGLPLAQDIARRHHGLIDCCSQPGCTCFSLLLPVMADRLPVLQEPCHV